MKNKKVVFIIIIVFIFLFTATYFQNPKLLDRALYRVGIQEQVCFSENIVSNLEGAKNIAAVGDIALNKNSLETLQSLNSVDPEIILFLGDLSYTTADEWIEFTNFLEKEKTFVTLGDDDLLYEEEFLEYYNMENLFYSFDFENVHFVTISSEKPYSKESKQYNFLRNDLANANLNENIDWIIFWLHKPLYFSNSPNGYTDLIVLHELLEQYDVDLVLQADFHTYERSKPITSDGIIVDHSKCSYTDPKGQIFVTVGTGGHSHANIKNKFDWSVIQNNNDFGFLNLKILNDRTIVGEFIANSGKIVDTFEIKKSV
jgi:predicted phosphodiesterase